MSGAPRTIALIGAITLVAAACGSAATGSPSATDGTGFAPSGSPLVSPGGSVAAETTSPSPSSLPSASLSPIAPGGAMTGTGLAAAIPTTVGGKTLEVRVATPADLPLFDGESGAAALDAFAAAVGLGPSGLAAAIGTTGDGSLTIGGLGLPGADATRISAAIAGAADVLGSGTVETRSIGGKDATVVTAGSETIYVYASGENVFIVRATDEALATEALQALP